MALIPGMLLTFTLLVLPIAIVLSSTGSDHQELSSHRLFWPLWFHQKLSHERHDRDSRNFQQSNANVWNREQFLAKESTSTIPPSSTFKHHVEQRGREQRPTTTKSEKFSAVAVAEYAGTRAIAYAGYHNNHRHQPRETVTQSYQHLTTTPSTYTKRHSGSDVHGERKSRMNSDVARNRGDEFAPDQFLAPTFITIEVNKLGWTQTTRLSFGCNKPTCLVPCLNGGVCTSPGRCKCPKGFTGNQCQTDIDECVTEKPCDQLCRNLPGTYECHCRPGFQLQKDGQSCRKNDTEDTAFEARDLENDFHEGTTTRRPSISSHDTENEVADDDLDQDYEIILKRLTKLEKQFAKGKKREVDTSEMSVKVASVIESINEMKRTVENMHRMQQEIYEMRNKLREYELEARKMQHLTNRLMELENCLRPRCRYREIGL